MCILTSGGGFGWAVFFAMNGNALVATSGKVVCYQGGEDWEHQHGAADVDEKDDVDAVRSSFP